MPTRLALEHNHNGRADGGFILAQIWAEAPGASYASKARGRRLEWPSHVSRSRHECAAAAVLTTEHALPITLRNLRFGELVARLRAVLRRTGPDHTAAPVLQAGDLEIDFNHPSHFWMAGAPTPPS